MTRRPENAKLVLRELMRRDFGAFLRKAYPWVHGGETLDWNWHLAAIVYQLNMVARGQTTRSIVTMPPRSLKTFTVSVAWVAWMLGHDPRRNFVCVSYSTELSAKFGRDCLSIMQSAWYRELFPRTVISSKRSAAHDYETTSGGGRLSTSITGTLTGRGGDIIVIDDPIKPDEAASEAAREAVNNWYKSTLSSRLNNKTLGAIVLVMQRLHEFDLAGMLLETGKWGHLKLQAIATDDQVIPLPGGKRHLRRRGDVLHPEREPLGAIEEQRASMGSAAFEAQCQQNPLPALGNVIRADWLKNYGDDFKPSDATGQIVQSWDCASKIGQDNSFSACITAFVSRRLVYILDVFRERLEFPELRDTAYRLAVKYRARDILIEDQSTGTPLISAFRADRPAQVPMPIRCQPIGDKQTRLLGVSGQIEAGQLLLPKDAPWLPEFKAELLGFPNVRYDDQCDALSQLMSWVQRREAVNTRPVIAGPIGFTYYDDGSCEITGDTDNIFSGASTPYDDINIWGT